MGCAADRRGSGRLTSVVALGLLVAAVAMLLFGHGHIATWVAVGAPTAVSLATGAIDVGDAADAVGALDSSIAFLVVAVPLVVLLGRIGFFGAAAERVAVGHRLVPSLWVFAALVTTVFNLGGAGRRTLTPDRAPALRSFEPVGSGWGPGRSGG